MIQLSTWEPRLSSFASYSGVLILSVLRATCGADSGEADVCAAGLGLPVGLAGVGVGETAGTFSASLSCEGGFTGNKKLHAKRIAVEISNASIKRFCCIVD